MDIEKVNAYKNEIRKYSYYVNQLNAYKERKMLAEHEERGLIGKGTDIERVQGSPNPEVKAQRRLKLVDIVEECDIMIGQYQQKISSIDESIENMDKDIGQAIKHIYCLKDSTLYDEAKKVGYSIKQLKRLMALNIESISDEAFKKVVI